MRRWISVLLCMVLLMTSLGVMATARAETVEFGLSVTEGKKGDTVTLTIDITADSYFSNATMYVHYDPAVVEYVEDSAMGGEATPAMNTMYMGRNHEDQKYVKLVYATVSGIQKSGALLTMEFTVLKNDPAVFSLSFDECCGSDENMGDFDVEYVTFGCVLNNREDSKEEVTAPIITPTTPSGGSETGITRAPTQKDEQTTATTKAPQTSADGDQPSQNGDSADDKDPDTAGTTVGGEQGDTASTTTSPAQQGETPGTTKPQSVPNSGEQSEPDDTNVGAVIAIIVLVVLLGGGIAVFAIVAARKAKQEK